MTCGASNVAILSDRHDKTIELCIRASLIIIEL